MLNYLLFIVILLVSLTSCNSEKCVENTKECACPKNLNPVCGCNDVTYGNPCEAECKGIKYTMGKCE